MNPLDPHAQEAIRAGRAGEAPTRADRERVRGKLAVAMAAGLAGPAVATPPAKWWAAKYVLGASAVVLIGVSAFVLTRKAEPEPPPVLPSPPPVVAVARAPVAEPEPVDEPEAATPPPEPGEPAPVKKTKRKKPVVKEPVVEPPAPVVVAPPAAPPPPVQLEPPKREDTLEAETQGLREVHAALRAKEPARALALIEEQDRRFPLGQLRPEREAAKVLALCASSPADGARSLATFVERHPGSPLLARLKAACAR